MEEVHSVTQEQIEAMDDCGNHFELIDESEVAARIAAGLVQARIGGVK